MTTMHSAASRSTGFSLIEMAVVLAVVGLLVGGMMVTLSAQVAQHNIDSTQNRLQQAREALIGFAIANGRLPCPASATSNGVESPANGGICTNPYNGYLPAVTLGFQPVDNNGYAVDAWNNRIRYAVTQTTVPNSCTSVTTGVTVSTPSSPPFTSQAPNGLTAYGVSCLPSDLVVCKSATGISGTSCGSNNSVTNQDTVVALVYSVGSDYASAPGGAGIDEAANLNNDAVFVSHPPAPAGASGGEFDDQLAWIPVGVLYGRMTMAGVLP